MNFRVIDGTYEDTSCFNDFEKDYLNPNIPNKELKQKYQISKGMFKNWTKIIRDKHGIRRKPVPAKYYHTNGNNYVITKWIDGDIKYFGRIPFSLGKSALFEAIQICKDMDWDCEACRIAIKEFKNACNKNQGLHEDT